MRVSGEDQAGKSTLAHPQVDPETIGARIRRSRQQRGLSQWDLARLADVSQAAISNYESGKRELSLALALRIAAALDITLSDLTTTGDLVLLRDSRLGRAMLQKLVS